MCLIKSGASYIHHLKASPLWLWRPRYLDPVFDGWNTNQEVPNLESHNCSHMKTSNFREPSSRWGISSNGEDVTLYWSIVLPHGDMRRNAGMSQDGGFCSIKSLEQHPQNHWVLSWVSTGFSLFFVVGDFYMLKDFELGRRTKVSWMPVREFIAKFWNDRKSPSKTPEPCTAWNLQKWGAPWKKRWTELGNHDFHELGMYFASQWGAKGCPNPQHHWVVQVPCVKFRWWKNPSIEATRLQILLIPFCTFQAWNILEWFFNFSNVFGNEFFWWMWPTWIY